MNNLQAKQMLKQVDCHGIPRGYNGGYSELYKYCLGCIQKLERIEKILKARSFTDNIGNACYFDDSERIRQIKEVLENE